MIVMNLATLKTLFIDGDGVLWHADRAVPRLVEFFATLHRRGIRWGLLSNNAAPTVDDFVDKLRGFGVEAERGNIISSSTVTAAFLGQRYPAKSTLYVIGQQGLKQSLSDAGFGVADGDAEPVGAVAVVIGIDWDFTYRKMAVATRLIRGGAAFIATNTDATYPTPDGLAPGAGSIVAAVAIASGQQPAIMGKPEATMYRVAMQQFEADPATTVMLGDRLETDIAGAKPLGLGTILVLSGVSTREDVASSGIAPDLIYDDIGALADVLGAIQQ